MKLLQRLSYWIERWFLWVIVTGLSWFLALVLSSVVSLVLDPVVGELAGYLIGFATGGALIGMVQWGLLRPEARGFGWWEIATIVGWGGSLHVAVQTSKAGNLTLIGGLIGGLVFGVLQWLALQRDREENRYWLLKAVLAWALAWIIGLVLLGVDSGALVEGSLSQATAVSALGWLVLGLLAVMAVVLLYPRKEEKDIRKRIKWLP